jgi:uncharacterized protein YbaA (DUF1428 family)
MPGYFDLYLLPIPKKNMKAYRGMANVFGQVVREHGATEYREFVSTGAKTMPGCKGVEQILKPKKSEAMVFSVVGFKSKKHRDRVNQKVFEDPRMGKMMKKKPVFDMQRMYLSEFEAFVGFKNR